MDVTSTPSANLLIAGRELADEGTTGVHQIRALLEEVGRNHEELLLPACNGLEKGTHVPFSPPDPLAMVLGPLAKVGEHVLGISALAQLSNPTGESSIGALRQFPLRRGGGNCGHLASTLLPVGARWQKRQTRA